VPKPGPHEVLIELDTIGVGSWDASIREGTWRKPGRPHFPLVPGTDGAGTVVGKGARVRRFKLGDRVYAYEFGNRQGGFYAEFVVADADHAGHVPERLSLAEAGAAATTGLTALQGITALRLRRGETMLIFGASGAVGTMAVQFSTRHGVRVIATASGAAARRLVRALGADAVVDARSDDLAEQLRRAAPSGIDAVLALGGGQELERCLDLVRTGGRLVHPNGIEPSSKPRRTLRIKTYDAIATPEAFGRLHRALSGKGIRVPVAAIYPLARADDAHRRLREGHILGRLALRVGSQGRHA
jgi:NADPH:quinone reductase-like Zn-dependent oxidoreductase